MINKVILVGHVGADPEIVTFESGNKTAKLRLATTSRTYNKETKETTEHTEWHSVALWGPIADVADKYVKKGSQLYIEGSLRTREYTDRDGKKRYTTEIVGNTLKLLGGRPSEPAHNGAGTTYQPEPQPAPEMPTPQPIGDDIDDLPF
jgi:single-strand DNA-binding protein